MRGVQTDAVLDSKNIQVQFIPIKKNVLLLWQKSLKFDFLRHQIQKLTRIYHRVIILAF